MYAGFDLIRVPCALCSLKKLSARCMIFSILTNTITCKMISVLRATASGKEIKLSATKTSVFWSWFKISDAFNGGY